MELSGWISFVNNNNNNERTNERTNEAFRKHDGDDGRTCATTRRDDEGIEASGADKSACHNVNALEY